MDGTWVKVLDGLRAGCDEVEGKNWTVSADSTIARAISTPPEAPANRPATIPQGGGIE